MFVVRLTAQRWLYQEAEIVSPVAQYAVWVLFPAVFIWFSTGFTHLVGPTAIGESS
jgi:chloride channel 2